MLAYFKSVKFECEHTSKSVTEKQSFLQSAMCSRLDHTNIV